MDGDSQRESFGATSGKVFGFVGLAVGVGFVAFAVTSSSVSWGAVSFGVLLVALSWATLLRPTVSVVDGDLVLRGMVTTVSIPLGAVEQVAVRQVLTVVAGDKKYSSAAVGRGRREMFREQVRSTGSTGGTGGGGAGGLAGPGTLGGAISAEEGAFEGTSYGLFVETRLRTLATDARKDAGIRVGSAEQDALADGIRRVWAWPEIVVIAVALVAVVVLLAV